MRPRRRTLLLAVAAASLLAVVALVALLGGGDDGQRQHPDHPRRGVAVDIVFGEPPEQIRKDVDAAAELGSDVIRVSLQWPGLEPGRGVYADWYLDLLDALVARAREQRIRVLLTPVFTPCWATGAGRDDPAGCQAPGRGVALQTQHPADPADYARLMVLLARRYGSALAGLEVWNEPNLEGFWAPGNAPEDYAALACAVHRAVRAASPSTRVVAGAVAGADVAFLDRLYAAGMGRCLDALSLHLYNDGRAPDQRIAPRFARATFLQGLQALRPALRRLGERRPVWVTELGWNTSTQRGGAFNDGVTPAQQAAYLGRALDLLGDPDAGVDVVRTAMVYRLRDPAGGAPADPQAAFGLIGPTGERKPAFDAVRERFRRPAPEPRTP